MLEGMRMEKPVSKYTAAKHPLRVPTERTESGMQWSEGERRRHGPSRSESKDAGKMKMGRWQGM
jgi:hypothetical protein